MNWHKSFICLSALILLFFPLTVYSMNSINSGNLFDHLPREITHIILINSTNNKPWKNFFSLQPLKLVCTQWNNFFSDDNTCCSLLDIPKMHFAAMTDKHLNILQLKHSGHSTLVPDSRGLIPAHYAAACKSYQALKMLNVGYAVTQFHQKLKKYTENDPLIKNIATLKCNDEYDVTSLLNIHCDLMEAIKNNYFESFFTILSDAPADFDTDQYTNSIKENKADPLFVDLINYRMQCREEKAFFYRLIKNENISDKFFNRCIEKKVNFNVHDEEGLTALHYAADNPGLSAVLSFLLNQNDIDVNQFSSKLSILQQVTPLQTATISNNIPAVTALLNTQKCILAGKFNPMRYAVEYGNNDTCFDLFIDADADIHASLPPNNDTLLHIAAENNQPSLLQKLIQPLRHTINTQNNYGYTPLILTTFFRHRAECNDCAKLLLQYGADVTLVSHHGETALHCAASFNQPFLVSLLLRHKSDINAQLLPHCIDKDGTHCGLYTPLHFAARRGLCDIINILLNHGADKKLKTKKDKTALDLAREYKHQKAIKLLL